MANPEQQGLKLDPYCVPKCVGGAEMANPEQQGLKPFHRICAGLAEIAEMANPEQQGLKHPIPSPRIHALACRNG